MEITLQYWQPKNEWKTSDNFTYLDTTSALIKTIVLEGTKEEVFAKFYHLNNKLRYCNGTYYKFEDKVLEREYYDSFIKTYNTVSNYYGGGVVD